MTSSSKSSSTSMPSSRSNMERQCREFYQKFLQPHEGEENSSWVIVVLARRKYLESFNYPNMQLCQEVLRAKFMTEQAFLNMLELVTFKAGHWRDNKTGNDAPDRKAWVCYISANSLDERKAFFATKALMDQQVTEMALTSMRNDKNTISSSISTTIKAANIPSMYMSCLQKNARRQYVKLDIDTKETKNLSELSSVIRQFGIPIHLVVETRGGFHILVPVGPNLQALYALQKKVVNQWGKSNTWITIESPSISPRLAIPGMYQADFTPCLMGDDFDLSAYTVETQASEDWK